MSFWIYEFEKGIADAIAVRVAGMRKEEKELVVYCDGRCEIAEGETISRYAYVIYHDQDKIAEGESQTRKDKNMTSNVAEYLAVLRGIEALKELGYAGRRVRVRSDSRLVMQQLGMLCVVRSPRLQPLWRKVRTAAKAFEVEWEWVPRAWNREVDALTRGMR